MIVLSSRQKLVGAEKICLFLDILFQLFVQHSHGHAHVSFQSELAPYIFPAVGETIVELSFGLMPLAFQASARNLS